jgi:hypothetical protein
VRPHLAIGVGTNLDGDWIDYVLHENFLAPAGRLVE